ncbi:MAG: hypothetical protein WCQ55_07965, partial [Paludibacteraceae bacterium]
HFVHYYTSLWTNGYKKQAVSPLFGVGYASGFLNGFTPEYVHHIGIGDQDLNSASAGGFSYPKKEKKYIPA